MAEAEEHQSKEDLESYSLGRLAPDKIASLEQHLLICARCRDKLHAIEPYTSVHFTSDGPVYSRVTKLHAGRYLARHWGQNLEGGKEFGTLAGARSYLARTFTQMFPEHVCTGRCGPTDSI